METECPLGVAFTPARLPHLLSRHLAQPSAEDEAEIGRLLAASTRSANAAFLSALLPARAGTVDEDDAVEACELIGLAKRDASVAALSPLLVSSARPRSLDVEEALSLAAAASRPRMRGLLRLVAAKLAAAEARHGVGDEAAVPADLFASMTMAPSSTSAAVSSAELPSCLPPTESTVLVVALAGMHEAACEIGSLISGASSAIELPGAPLAPTRAFPWLLHTRYYSASLFVLVVSEDVGRAPLDSPDAGAALASVASGCGAVVVLFDDGGSEGAGWARLTSVWEAAMSGQEEEPDVCIALGVRPSRAAGMEAATSSPSPWGSSAEPPAERIEWALDHHVEVLYSQLDADRPEAEAAAAASRGDAPAAGMSASEDAEGLARLIEALQCRLWPAHDSSTDRTAIRQDHERAWQAFAASAAAAMAPEAPAEAPAEAAGAGEGQFSREAAEYFEQLAHAEEQQQAKGEPEPTMEEERQQDSVERLMERMGASLTQRL